MPSQLAAVAERLRAPRARGPEGRIEALFAGDPLWGADDLTVRAARRCGRVEVRVSGPGATLTLSFDPGEFRPTDVRCLVGAAVARYRSSLLAMTP